MYTFCLWWFLVFSLCLWSSSLSVLREDTIFFYWTKDISIYLFLYWIKNNFFKCVFYYSAVYSTNWVFNSSNYVFSHLVYLFPFKIWFFLIISYSFIMTCLSLIISFNNFKLTQFISVVIYTLEALSLMFLVSLYFYYHCYCFSCDVIFVVLVVSMSSDTFPSTHGGSPPKWLQHFVYTSSQRTAHTQRLTFAWIQRPGPFPSILVNCEVLSQPPFQLHYVSTSPSVQSCFPHYLISVSESTPQFPCKQIHF